MKAGFYPKLAFDGIRKNKQMYLPYILTCVGMVMMHYIINFLQYSEAITRLQFAHATEIIFGFGGWTIAVFALIFLFYTNSFLMRRRKKEFGLYNILGMGKRNIGRILFWEVVIISAVSLGAGLFSGIAFSKLAELGLLNLLGGEINFDLTVSSASVLKTLKIFGAIFLLLFFNSLRQVRFSNAVSLIRSENIGEKPPKGNILFGILGVLILIAAYFIAVTTEATSAELSSFFIAVVMVITGTYLIMISGSVLFCRALQKKKNYYYKANHFVSVSSMVYRMKRNGAGLASVCVLATMILVILSSTTALYFGAADSINEAYPSDIILSINIFNLKDSTEEGIAALKQDISDITARFGAVPEIKYEHKSVYINGQLDGSSTIEKYSTEYIDDFPEPISVQIFSLEDIYKSNETLGEDEVIIYTKSIDYTEKTITFKDCKTYNVKKVIDKTTNAERITRGIVPTLLIGVADLEDFINDIKPLIEGNGDYIIWSCEFDVDIEKEKQLDLCADIDSYISKTSRYSGHPLSKAEGEINAIGLYGGFFYLGVILSIVFIFATVLIIYYKQIAEGYEDCARFDIMQKVGMTKKEIRKSINSQLLTVFFLPLIGAGCHLTFAYPMLRNMLFKFSITNSKLFTVTTLISFAVFAVFYTVVYRLTSNAYYNIVSGKKSDENKY